MIIWLSLFLWLLFGWASYTLAQERGRNPIAWFFIGLLFGLLGLLFLYLLPPLENQSNTPPPENHLQQLKWFYVDQNNQQHGPLSFKELSELWEHQKVLPTSYVWSEEMSEWKQIQKTPLHQLLLNIKKTGYSLPSTK